MRGYTRCLSLPCCAMRRKNRKTCAARYLRPVGNTSYVCNHAKQQAGKNINLRCFCRAVAGSNPLLRKFKGFPRQQAAHGCLGRNSVVLLRSSGSFSTCRIPCEFSRLWYALNIPALLICHRAFCPAKYRGRSLPADTAPVLYADSATLQSSDFVFRKPFLDFAHTHAANKHSENLFDNRRGFRVGYKVVACSGLGYSRMDIPVDGARLFAPVPV